MDRFFGISAAGSTVKREVLAGITTFLVSAYIIFVNPAILSFSGIKDLQGLGVPFMAAMAATCLVAGVMTLTMGLYARYPFMMAPGMGLNAVVAFQLIVGMKLTWQEAMGVIVLEGLVILALVLLGFRQAVMEAIPMSLKRSIAVGIGFFIAFIGLVDCGFVVLGVPGAPVALGKMATPLMAVAIFGLLVTAALEVLKVRGSLLWGILLSTGLAIAINYYTAGAAFATSPGVAVIPKSFVSWPDLSTLGQGLNFGVFAKVGVLGALLAIFSICLSDFFDTLGTLVGVGEQAGFLKKNGNYPSSDLTRLLVVDSVGAALGGVAGSSTATTYIESGAGVAAGGRTGLTSVVTGILFLACMFLAPVAGIVPAQATGPALVIVGFIMFRANILEIVRSIPDDPGMAVAEGLPILLTVLVMPFTYSITNGIGVGFVSYVFLKLIGGKAREVHWLMWLVSFAFVSYFFLH